MSIPLTTPFNPPSQCTEDTWWIGSYELLGGTGYSSCLPPSYTPTSSFYYSPGIYCPLGYSNACMSNVGAETIVTCCPTGFSCQSENDYAWESTLGCTSAVSSTFEHTLLVSTGTVVNPDGPGGGANAYSVQLRFHSSDLITSTSTSASSPSSSPSTSTPTSTTVSSTTFAISATASPTASSAPSNNGLSVGAKAGISVAVVLGVALIAAIIYLARTIGKRSSNQHVPGGIHLPEWVKPPDTVYGSVAQDPGMVEHPRYELGEAQHAPYELPVHR